VPDPPPAAVAPRQVPAAEKPAPAAPTASSPAPADPPPTGDDTVPDGTAATVLAWVGSDPARARAALAAERQRSKPRTSLLAKLGKLATAVVHDLTPASVIHHQTAEEV